MIDILKNTASYQGLVVSDSDQKLYQALREQNLLTTNLPAEKVLFGNGLVNAEAAVQAVKQVTLR